MRVLILDMGSRMNRFGGEQRVSAMLYDKLKRYFETFYLGYKTDYIKKSKDTIIIPRSGNLKNARNSTLSEMLLFRTAYYYFFVRKLNRLGMPKTELLNKISQIKPDIIISNSIHDFALLKYLKDKKINFKSVYIDHGSISTSNTMGFFSKEGIPLTVGTGINSTSIKNAKSKFFNFFNMNIALNMMQFNAINSFTKKVTYIPNSLDVKVLSDKRIEKSVRKKYNIDEKDFVFLYIGRMFDRQKNVSTLVKAFAKTKNPKFRLLLVGDGPSINIYKELASGDNRVIFTGRFDGDMVNYIYNISNAMVLPSVWEGFALTILEAAAHKIPLIVSKNVYTEDYKKKGINLISFSTFNENELKEVIERIATDTKFKKRAISESEKLSKIFNGKSMVRSYKKVLKKLNNT
jgi:glycosyltransferase involved in cell wall biosynthesis